MKYDVTVAGPSGHEIVTVEADSGDEAAKKAYRAGAVIRSIVPSAVVKGDDMPDTPKRGGKPA